ncbi:MAG: DOMON domain-containing protein [Desulfobacula sp.]|nr:DOMON domain-containing protein [Desulfobacula sp.]
MKNNLWISILFIMVFFLPLSVSAMDYQHTLQAKGLSFSWSLDGDKIHVSLTAETTGWVAIGFDPEKAMQGANIIIGAVKKGKFKIEDHYGDRKRGHSNDEKLGGTNDVLNPAGIEEDGVTTISFSFPLKSDDKYDKPIQTDGIMKIMLAHGAGKDSFRNRHPYRTIYEVNLSTGENKKLK